MSKMSQKNNLISIKVSSLGDDDLLLQNFTVFESLSTIFTITAEVVVQDNTSLENVVGKDITIRWNAGNKSKRYFSGHIFEAVQLNNNNGLLIYSLIIRPWLNFLAYSYNSQIFLDQSVPQIIEKVLKDVCPSGKYKLQIKRTYPERPFCMQYKESSLNFVLRLMEEEGIYYYFQQENGKHTLQLVDDKSAHKTYSGYDKIPYRKLTRNDKQCVQLFHSNYSFCPSSFSTNGYDYTNPKKSLLAEQKGSIDMTPKCEIYSPASFPSFDGKGKDYASIGMDRAEANSNLFNGQTNAGGICAGYSFSLTDFDKNTKLNKSYLVVSTTLSVKVDTTENSTVINFTAIEQTKQFRPAIAALRPNLALQTATVSEVGKSENLGMIRVKFYWDQSGHTPSSAWIRVAQSVAGNKWGTFFIPGMDQEVVVNFIDGDPCQQIVSLALYNGSNEIPVDFKDAEKHSGIISQNICSKLYFEDDVEDKTKAKVNLFSEGDRDVQITGLTTEAYGKSLTTTVGEDGLSLTVEGDTAKTFKKNLEITCEGEEKVSISKDSTINITGNREENISKDLSVNVTGNRIEKVSKNITRQGMKIEDKASQEFKSSAGASSSLLKAAGITLKGTTIKQEATGQFTAKGAMATVQASGILTIKGSMTKIN